MFRFGTPDFGVPNLKFSERFAKFRLKANSFGSITELRNRTSIRPGRKKMIHQFDNLVAKLQIFREA